MASKPVNTSTNETHVFKLTDTTQPATPKADNYERLLVDYDAMQDSMPAIIGDNVIAFPLFDAMWKRIAAAWDAAAVEEQAIEASGRWPGYRPRFRGPNYWRGDLTDEPLKIQDAVPLPPAKCWADPDCEGIACTTCTVACRYLPRPPKDCWYPVPE